MPYIHSATCEIKKEGLLGRFSGCKDAPVGVCVYCGRAFCHAHGEQLEDGQDVCSRKHCVAKKDDVAAHLKYRTIVMAENERGRCGITDCPEIPTTLCGRCKAQFCLRHVDTREETILEGRVQVPKMSTLCSHCWDRRPIWLKT